MKLEKLALKNKVLSKEAMTITFGGFTALGTNCTTTSSGTSDCSDASFD